MMQKLWYPFRKKTLEKLQANVHGIQGRLKLTLHVLQLEAETESWQLLTRLVGRKNDLSVSMSYISTQNQQILDDHTSELFQKVRAWLSPADPRTSHDTARQRHESEAGDWLMRHSQYQRWEAGKLDHLWLYGKAGCGKTILCSVTIDRHSLILLSPCKYRLRLFLFLFVGQS